MTFWHFFEIVVSTFMLLMFFNFLGAEPRTRDKEQK